MNQNATDIRVPMCRLRGGVGHTTRLGPFSEAAGSGGARPGRVHGRTSAGGRSGGWIGASAAASLGPG